MEYVYLRVKCVSNGEVIRKYLIKRPSNLSDADIDAVAKLRICSDLAIQGYRPGLIFDILAAYKAWFRQAPKTYKKIFISEDGSVTAEIRRG